MTRDYDFVSRKIITSIPTMEGRVAKEDTKSGAWLKFMRGCEVWVAKTTKTLRLE